MLQQRAPAYSAQLDVLSQLSDKLDRQWKAASAKRHAPSWTKLQRDWERVKVRAQQLQQAPALQQQQQQQSKQQQQQQPSGLSLQQQQQLQHDHDQWNEQIMREREEELRSLNRGMHQVNEIFKDLAALVSNQQEQVDSIETQMEESRVNAEQGLAQVEKANEKYGNNCVIS